MVGPPRESMTPATKRNSLWGMGGRGPIVNGMVRKMVQGGGEIKK